MAKKIREFRNPALLEPGGPGPGSPWDGSERSCSTYILTTVILTNISHHKPSLIIIHHRLTIFHHRLTIYYLLVNQQFDPENHQLLMETNLPIPIWQGLC